jgi:hypothetical protein
MGGRSVRGLPFILGGFPGENLIELGNPDKNAFNVYPAPVRTVGTHTFRKNVSFLKEYYRTYL